MAVRKTRAPADNIRKATIHRWGTVTSLGIQEHDTTVCKRQWGQNPRWILTPFSFSRPIARRAADVGLEAQPHLALERSASTLTRDLTKRVGRVHIEAGLVRSRVVQYVGRVDAERKALGFAKSE